MTIWEDVVVNLEKAAKKVSSTAALFSERIKAEIAIARLRIKADEAKSQINEQHMIIGRKLVELRKKNALPESMDEFFKQEEIIASLAEIAARERDLQDLANEITNQETAFKPEERRTEEPNA